MERDITLLKKATTSRRTSEDGGKNIGYKRKGGEGHEGC